MAKERIRDINPEIKVRTYETFFMPDTENLFDFSEYDYVVDAIDTVTVKLFNYESEGSRCTDYFAWVPGIS